MLKVFNSPEGQEIRVVDKDGEPWFVAADVCKALDISDTSNAVRGNPTRGDGGLDEDERGTCTVSTPGGAQEVLAVSESGLYSLIFKSRKPEAKAFRRWVTHEVLPSIRKTGGYHSPGAGLSIPETATADQLDALGSLCRRKATLLRELDNVHLLLKQWPSLPVSLSGEAVGRVGGRAVPRHDLDPAVAAWVAEFVVGDAFGSERTTPAQVLEGIKIPATRANQMQVGVILRSMGFTRHREHVGGHRQYVYIREPEPVFIRERA